MVRIGIVDLQCYAFGDINTEEELKDVIEKTLRHDFSKLSDLTIKNAVEEVWKLIKTEFNQTRLKLKWNELHNSIFIRNCLADKGISYLETF